MSSRGCPWNLRRRPVAHGPNDHNSTKSLIVNSLVFFFSNQFVNIKNSAHSESMICRSIDLPHKKIVKIGDVIVQTSNMPKPHSMFTLELIDRYWPV